jgi:pyridoxal phosphate enzyme (YggS family)
MSNGLYENICKIKTDIEKICSEINRNPQDITLIAASKTVSAERLKPLKGYGINICGENRVQELLEKYGSVDTEWHFIGRLQTNKVKYIYDKIKLLHSLDRISLAQEIEKRCSAADIVLEALIEINVGGEENKGGIPPAEVLKFFNEVKNNFPHIRICGIMAVMPVNAEEKYYLLMKDIYDRIKAYSSDIKYLSMGMSGDYITAIKYGANIIRLGRALFGERIYV